MYFQWGQELVLEGVKNNLDGTIIVALHDRLLFPGIASLIRKKLNFNNLIKFYYLIVIRLN